MTIEEIKNAIEVLEGIRQAVHAIGNTDVEDRRNKELTALSLALSLMKAQAECGEELPNYKEVDMTKMGDLVSKGCAGGFNLALDQVTPIFTKLKTQNTDLHKTCDNYENQIEILKSEIAKLKAEVTIAHKVFGVESDSLGKIIKKLKTENKELAGELTWWHDLINKYHHNVTCPNLRTYVENLQKIEQKYEALKARITVEGIETFLFWYIGIEIAEHRSIDMHDHESRKNLAQAIRDEIEKAIKDKK